MLNENEIHYLKLLEEQEARFPVKLNGWEQGFINDILERFNDYGEMTILSENQWRIISRIGENLGL